MVKNLAEGVYVTLNHRVPGSSPGAPTKVFVKSISYKEKSISPIFSKKYKQV